LSDLKTALGLVILGYLGGWVLGRLARTAVRALALAAVVWFALFCLGFSLRLPSLEHLWKGLSTGGHKAEPLATVLWATLSAHLPLAVGLLLGLLKGVRARRR
jgi:hypothetical protein